MDLATTLLKMMLVPVIYVAVLGVGIALARFMGKRRKTATAAKR
jgi:hypothetical protein